MQPLRWTITSFWYMTRNPAFSHTRHLILSVLLPQKSVPRNCRILYAKRFGTSSMTVFAISYVCFVAYYVYLNWEFEHEVWFLYTDSQSQPLKSAVILIFWRIIFHKLVHCFQAAIPAFLNNYNPDNELFFPNSKACCHNLPLESILFFRSYFPTSWGIIAKYS